MQTPEEEGVLLAAAEREVAKQLVIGPYAMPVESSAEGLRPTSRRESIRAQRGPSPAVGHRVPRPAAESTAMYRYDEFDHTLVAERVAQFREQVRRRLAGELTEDEFKPLRLMNGLYLQLHAYMLRVAIPYGTICRRQLRMLAHIARRYDRGFGHFTTRQNIQYNWPKLPDVPDILAELAEVEMHAIQTSGNCIRNVTADHYAGAAADEIEDPRIYAEIIRQWSTLHPEFSFLPRKFKIAITGAPNDRAAGRVHDIGLQIRRNEAGEVGFEVVVGGGQGRTPIIGPTIRDFLPKQHLLSYLEAILRVYNQLGRRDNSTRRVSRSWCTRPARKSSPAWSRRSGSTFKGRRWRCRQEEIARIEAYFAPPAFETLDRVQPDFEAKRFEDRAFAAWVRTNVAAHKQPGYAIVTISLKPIGGVPGDATAEQMDAGRRSGRALQLRRNPGQPRAEPGPAACQKADRPL